MFGRLVQLMSLTLIKPQDLLAFFCDITLTARETHAQVLADTRQHDMGMEKKTGRTRKMVHQNRHLTAWQYIIRYTCKSFFSTSSSAALTPEAKRSQSVLCNDIVNKPYTAFCGDFKQQCSPGLPPADSGVQHDSMQAVLHDETVKVTKVLQESASHHMLSAMHALLHSTGA